VARFVQGDEMQNIGIAASVIGVIGISGLTAAFRFSRSWGRQFRFLRLHRTDPLDIVLPTSERKVGGLGIRYVRSVTAVGNMRGATEVAQTVGRISRVRRISVSVSEELESSLSGDLVVLGLPGKNASSRLAIGRLCAKHPEIGLAIRESADQGCNVSLGGHSEDYEVKLQTGSNKIPDRDVALIIAWVNPFSLRKRRLLLCAGFTAYGTAAAAKYLVHDLLPHRYATLRASSHGILPSLLAPRTWPCFAMLIEARLINDQVVSIDELAFAALPDPGKPPW
jgi:hypothetical protein